MAGTYKIYISAVDIEVETEAAGFVEKVIPADGFGDDKAVGDAIEDDDKVISSPEWSERVVSRSEGENYGDVTFILCNDTHYGWHVEDDAHDDYDELLAVVTDLNTIVGVSYPEVLTGVVETPLFVIHPGDALHDDYGYPTSYNTFILHYGSDGTDGVLDYPLYLGHGNHDSEDAMTALVVSRHGARHYRYSAGGIHFICCDLFPQSLTTVGDYYRDSTCTIPWLEHQLSLIGKNDRVILFQHYDYQTTFGFNHDDYNWWGTTDADELLTVIEDYNVIAILHGHDHGTVLPGDSDIYEPYQSYNMISASSSYYFVFRVTDTKLQAAQRNTDSDTWISLSTQNITIPSRVTYGADKVVAADGFENEKAIS